MLGQIGTLIVETILGLIVYIALLRFYMQVFRAPFRNPAGQFVMALTDWGVQPLRKFVPGLRGLDLSSFVMAFLIQLLMIGLVAAMHGDAGRSVSPGLLLILTLFGLLRASLHLLIGVVIIDFVLSWVNPYTPFAPVLAAITRPFYGIFRRFIPPLGGFDLSPLFVLLAIQVVLIVLNHLERAAIVAT